MRITGRIDDQLGIGGGRISALLVDEALESLGVVVDGIGFTEFMPDGVQMPSVVVQLREGTDPAAAAKEIRQVCRVSIGDVAAHRVDLRGTGLTAAAFVAIRYQPLVPGGPLKGPMIFEVIHPP